MIGRALYSLQTAADTITAWTRDWKWYIWFVPLNDRYTDRQTSVCKGDGHAFKDKKCVWLLVNFVHFIYTTVTFEQTDPEVEGPVKNNIVFDN